MTSTPVPDTEAYAEALVCLAQAVHQLHNVETSLLAVLDRVEHNPEVKRFMHNPVIHNEGKHDVLARLLGDTAPLLLVDFLGILVDHRHLSALPAIAAAFFDKVSDRRGKTAGEIVSAAPLPPETVAAISEATEALLGKRVHLRPRVDRNLIGGAVIRVGDFVLDNTVDRRIEDIRAHLLEDSAFSTPA